MSTALADASPMPDLATLRATLETHGQTHLLRYADELDDARRQALLEQLSEIDFELVAGSRDDPDPTPAGDVIPAPYYPLPDTAAAGGGAYDAAHFRAVGVDLLQQGAVGLFTVAGGQGTRLGWRGPKGTYPATPVTGKPLFRVFAEQLMAAQRKYDTVIPWYIMTSPANDAETRSFFADNNCFGLMRSNVFMFPQGMMPALDATTGDLLLEDRHRVAMSPDGHGGSIRALRASGALEDMKRRGIRHISYFQVDNPLVNAIDPLFLGLHHDAPDSSGEMSSKMVAKTDPSEKVGVFARAGEKTMVIEYSDLPDELAAARDPDGALRYRAGSIAIHLISVDFVERLTAPDGRFRLPYHRARKKVACLDPATGTRVEPSEPNAIKLETFVFDALPLARSSIVLESDRREEFAPIKNADGADSPATSHLLQSDRAARWLAAHGVELPWTEEGHVNARVEISPLTALEPADLVAVDLPRVVGVGEELAV